MPATARRLGASSLLLGLASCSFFTDFPAIEGAGGASSGPTSGGGGEGAGTGAAGAGGAGLLTPCGCPVDQDGECVRVTSPLGFAPTTAGMPVTNSHVVVAGPDGSDTAFGWIERGSFALTETTLEGDAGEGSLAGTPAGFVAYARGSSEGIERVSSTGSSSPVETAGLSGRLRGLTWAGTARSDRFLATLGSDLVEIDPASGSGCRVAVGAGQQEEGFAVAAGFGASAATHAWTTGDAGNGFPAAFRYIDQSGCPGGAPITGPQSTLLGQVRATTIAGWGTAVTVRAQEADDAFRISSFALGGVPAIEVEETNGSHALVMSSAWTYFPGPVAGLTRCTHDLADCSPVLAETFGDTSITNMTLAADGLALYVAYEAPGGSRVACVELGEAL